MLPTWRRRSSILVIGTAVVAIAATWTFRAGIHSRSMLASPRVARSVEEDLLARASFRDTVGEMTFVFLTSGACSACSDQRLPALIEAGRQALRSRAQVDSLAFGTIGVGVDQTPAEGVEDLQRFRYLR